ncbi:hypothetical protein HOA92_02840 [archaeon]|nr:hypothetical protein [archaeon]MBT6761952.1 hypothetical protein [archaeon]
MAEYVLIPGETRLKREDFLELLLRRMDHDFDDVFYKVRSSASVLKLLSGNGQLQEQTLATINPSVTHAENITKSIKALGLNPRTTQFDLGELLGKLQLYTENKWVENVDVGLTCEGDIKVSNLEAPTYAQVWNFITNAYAASALKATKTIEVSGQVIHLSADELNNLGVNSGLYTTDDEFVRISVRDHGRGIEEGKLERIFENGYTSKQGDTSNSGIGLALTETTARSVHGFVKVESEIGEGSTFSMYMPRERK